MKIRPLSEIDLARISPLPKDEKYRALQQVRYGGPPYSYAPIRGNLSDVLNLKAGMMGTLPRVAWQRIEDEIRKRSKSDVEEDANLRVGRGLFDYVESAGVTGRRHDIFPLALGATSKVVFWHPAVLLIDGRPIIPFFDPRRTKSLTAQGRRFVFSAMHERIRVADPDFSDVGLGIFQFTLTPKGPRVPILHRDAGVSLFSFGELDEMVRDTYEMWTEICEDRAEATRKKASGGGTGFI